MQYAVVDIETTGASALKGGKITEIAIYISDGIQILDHYSTLINPESNIPFHITRLTGISNEMVKDAPKFYEVAKKIYEFTDNKIFVAHNVSFDYGFLYQEFKDLGGSFSRKKMCTVKLSREHIPGLASYSLGKLCKSVGITLTNHHRADADALATTQLLHLILNDKIHQGTLFEPKSLVETLTEHLPNTPGVYMLHNKDDQIIYIGKSIGIRKRVQSHLSNFKSKKGQKIIEEVHRVNYLETGSEMLALFYESFLIKKQLPKYNVRERKNLSVIGAFIKVINGYKTIEIKRLNNAQQPIRSFERAGEGKLWLIEFIEKNALCMHVNEGGEIAGRGCFRSMIKKCDYCQNHSLQEQYNEKIDELLDLKQMTHSDFTFYSKGRINTEESYAVIQNKVLIESGLMSIETGKKRILVENSEMNRDYERLVRQMLKKANQEGSELRVEVHTSALNP